MTSKLIFGAVWVVNSCMCVAQPHLTFYVSDITPVSAVNGWGPVENDRSVGGTAAKDGQRITLNGKTYDKGLGVHAYSELVYQPDAGCYTLAADIGVDDEVSSNGSVIFEVWGDGNRLFESPLLTGDSATVSIAVSIRGVRELKMVVLDGGDGYANDVAAWAEARATCDLSAAVDRLRPSGPVIVDAPDGAVVSGISVFNPNGHCIEIRPGSRNVVIEDNAIGPCNLAGVDVHSSSGVTIRNNWIHDTSEEGISLVGVDNVQVRGNRIENSPSGIHVLESTRIAIAYNEFRNARGPWPRGQFVQFDKVIGPSNRIICNYGVNTPGESNAEDAISLYQSYGVAADPILVQGNRIAGGGPSASGGGIMLGDNGGAYQIARDNVLVDPGQYGIAVASGTSIQVIGNTIVARQQPFTNVGISVWNQYYHSCNEIAVENNQVSWVARDGQQNPLWNAGNCGTVQGWFTNGSSPMRDGIVMQEPVRVCQELQF